MTDYDGKFARLSIHTIDITEANFAAQGALIVTLASTAAAISRGNVHETGQYFDDTGTAIPPTNPEVQIEKGWLFLYVDDNPFLNPGTDTVVNPGFGAVYQLTYPGALFTVDTLQTNSDEADLTSDEWIAAVAAFEALVRSPYGMPVTVVSVTGVGVDR
jgi:hypothetical protein